MQLEFNQGNEINAKYADMMNHIQSFVGGVVKLLLFVAFLILSIQVRANQTSDIKTNQEVVVLVPGFFNSFAAEYFSENVVNAFQEKGFKVYIAEGLNPIGTIENNGELLTEVLQKIEQLEGRRVRFNVVAHSMGGLYTLYVANKQRFDIKNLITVATPYKGIEFVQKWLDDSILFKALAELAYLDGIVQLTPDGVKKFLSGVRVQPDMKIVAFGGYQDKSLDIWNARFLSLPFRVSSHSISGDSDGIVSFESSLGLGEILTTSNTKASQYFDRQFRVNLDHWEQVLEGYSFIILGIRNPDYIKTEQTRFYNGIANYLETLL